MKKKFFVFLIIIASSLAFVSPIFADLKDTKLTYWSPKGGTFNHNSVNFKWRIISWDDVISVVLHIVPQAKPNESFVEAMRKPIRKRYFTGNEAKEVSVTVTGFDADRTYGWFLEVTTTEGTLTFVLDSFKTK